MSATNFTTTIKVDQSPEEVFNAITNVRGWWSEEIEGNTIKLNDEFEYHYEDVHRCKVKLIEVIQNKKIVWLVEKNYFKFTEDKTEWTGTKPTFEISEKRMAKQNFVLPILVWYQNMNVLTFVKKAGRIIFRIVY